MLAGGSCVAWIPVFMVLQVSFAVPNMKLMGILRKAIAGTGAFMTSGASLAVVQFRSDTERNTRQIKKLRQAVESAGGEGSGSGVLIGDDFGSPAPTQLNLTSYASTNAVSLTHTSDDQRPLDLAPGWKSHPELDGKECFWNGHKWTTMVR